MINNRLHYQGLWFSTTWIFFQDTLTLENKFSWQVSFFPQEDIGYLDIIPEDDWEWSNMTSSRLDNAGFQRMASNPTVDTIYPLPLAYKVFIELLSCIIFHIFLSLSLCVWIQDIFFFQRLQRSLTCFYLRYFSRKLHYPMT